MPPVFRLWNKRWWPDLDCSALDSKHHRTILSTALRQTTYGMLLPLSLLVVSLHLIRYSFIIRPCELFVKNRTCKKSSFLWIVKSCGECYNENKVNRVIRKELLYDR